ncbi:MAG: CBS domain-containing protein, partial [Opitutae bacterium]|nr:CBS domain-containing protein [Opitutae bacterium]
MGSSTAKVALDLRVVRIQTGEVVAVVRETGTADRSAGGVMNTEILALDHSMNAQQAINLIRDRVEETEIPYYAYIVDEYRHLRGVLSLRDLLLSPGRTLLKDLLREQNLIYVSFDVDKEEVARLISRYNFLALPVVDHEQRLLGIITVDDVIDIIQE